MLPSLRRSARGSLPAHWLQSLFSLVPGVRADSQGSGKDIGTPVLHFAGDTLDLCYHAIELLHDRLCTILLPYDWARPGNLEDVDEEPIVSKGAYFATLEPTP